VRIQNPNNAVPFVVEVDEKAKEARLQIPRKLLPNQRAALDNEEQDPRTGSGVSRLHTIVAGIALALALTLGGLWMVRQGGHFKGHGLALVLGALAFLSLGGVVWANAAVPRDIPPAPEKVVLPEGVKGQVVVEVVEKGDAIKLILPPSMLSKPVLKPELKHE